MTSFGMTFCDRTTTCRRLRLQYIRSGYSTVGYICYLRWGGYVFTCVCLSLCLLAGLLKNCWIYLNHFLEWLDIHGYRLDFDLWPPVTLTSSQGHWRSKVKIVFVNNWQLLAWWMLDLTSLRSVDHPHIRLTYKHVEVFHGLGSHFDCIHNHA